MSLTAIAGSRLYKVVRCTKGDKPCSCTLDMVVIAEEMAGTFLQSRISLWYCHVEKSGK